MIEFKNKRQKDEFWSWDRCHPRLRAMVCEIDRLLDYSKDSIENHPQIFITCVYRTPKENFSIYGRHKASAHCDLPSRAIDMAVHTSAHPHALCDKAVATIESFVEKYFARHDGFGAFLKHGESGLSEHLHLSVQT